MAQSPPYGQYPYASQAPPQGFQGPAAFFQPDVQVPVVQGYPQPAGMALPPGGQPAPSAPEMKVEAVAGYEGTMGFAPVLATPPPPSYESAREDKPAEEFNNTGFIKEEEAKEALVHFVSEHCCYGSKPAKNVQIVELHPSSAFHYTLESFTEERETGWHQEPYTGQFIDSPNNGPAPLAWSIPAQSPPLFTNSVQHIEVPHTASIKACQACMGSGTKLCHQCHGSGRVHCSHCNGRGHTFDVNNIQQSCTFCHGHGRKTCSHCHGNGRVKCQKCNGCAQVKVYIRLTVTWKIHKDDHVVEKSALPPQLITEVSGDNIFSQQNPRVWPISTFFEPEINRASQRLVDSHAEQLKATRLIMQRHNLRSVPVTQATARWDEKHFNFWVYGHEQKVFCPEYPHKCCCGCTIL